MTFDGAAVPRRRRHAARRSPIRCSPDLWLPLRFSERELATQRGAHYLDVIGRAAARSVRSSRRREEMRGDRRCVSPRLIPTPTGIRGSAVHEMRSAWSATSGRRCSMLLGAVGFVLLIVCVQRRQSDAYACDWAAPARWRCARRSAPAACGWCAACWSRVCCWRSLGGAGRPGHWRLGEPRHRGAAARAGDSASRQDTRVDGVVIAFTLGVSLLAARCCSVRCRRGTPRRLAISRVAFAEDSGTATGDRHRQRIRTVLIVAETALAVVLLVGAGLLLRSFMQHGRRSSSVQRGRAFRRSTCRCPRPEIPAARRACGVRRTLVARVDRRQPGVDAAGAIFGMPFTNFRYSISMTRSTGGGWTTTSRWRGRCRSAWSRPTTSARCRSRSCAAAPFAPSDRARRAARASSSTRRPRRGCGQARTRSATSSRLGRGWVREAPARAVRSSASQRDVHDFGPSAGCASDGLSRTRAVPGGASSRSSHAPGTAPRCPSNRCARIVGRPRSRRCRCSACARWSSCRRMPSRSRACTCCCWPVCGRGGAAGGNWHLRRADARGRRSARARSASASRSAPVAAQVVGMVVRQPALLVGRGPGDRPGAGVRRERHDATGCSSASRPTEPSPTSCRRCGWAACASRLLASYMPARRARRASIRFARSDTNKRSVAAVNCSVEPS